MSFWCLGDFSTRDTDSSHQQGLTNKQTKSNNNHQPPNTHNLSVNSRLVSASLSESCSAPWYPYTTNRCRVQHSGKYRPHGPLQPKKSLNSAATRQGELRGAPCPFRVTWTRYVCGTADSGIWVLKGDSRSRMLLANLDYLSVRWIQRRKYDTAWNSQGLREMTSCIAISVLTLATMRPCSKRYARRPRTL